MKPKVVIIGCGARGGETYGRYFVQSGDAEIVAICDNNAERLESYRKEFHLTAEQCFTDYNRCLHLAKSPTCA